MFFRRIQRIMIYTLTNIIKGQILAKWARLKIKDDYIILEHSVFKLNSKCNKWQWSLSKIEKIMQSLNISNIPYRNN